MSISENKALVLKAHEAFFKGDVESLGALLDPECLLHQCGFLQPVRGAKAIIDLAGRANRGVPEGTHTVVNAIAEHDLVAIQSRTVGLHTRDWFRDATGRRLVYDTMTLVRVREGRVVEIWNIQDTATVLSQLDAWPDSVQR